VPVFFTGIRIVDVSFHFGKEEDHSVPYLKSITRFMDSEDFESILEGVDAAPDRAEDLLTR
jgi:FMN-dependent NADH-azoreductase